MEISRRTLLRSTAAVAATGGWMAQSLTQAGSAFAASPAGDVVGKVTVGYQGWFACPGDGAPINAWWHWSNNWAAARRRRTTSSSRGRTCPSTRARIQTAYPNLDYGAPATLFSSYDQQTVDTHFLWMQQYGCDTAALQRFNPIGDEGPTRDAMATKVRSSAEKYSRKFYIMYDVTGWTKMQSEIKADWTNKMSAHTASSAYARQNGKPVVCVWGFGFNDTNHPWDAATCLDVVNWFKSQGCYVIGGVPREWRHGHRRLPRRVHRRLPRLQHALPVDGRRDRQRRGLDNALHQPHRAGPGRLQRQRRRLPALRAARRRVREPARARRLHAGGTSTTWSGRRRRASTSPCSTSTARATRSPRPPPPRPASRPDPGCRPWTPTAPPAPRTTTCASPATAARCSRARSP